MSQLDQLDPSIRESVTNMIADAFTQYQIEVRVNQTRRTPRQAQTFHVLNMFLSNDLFPHRLPKHLYTDRRTIDWEYFKNPEVKWALIDDLKSQFLLTADGRPAKLTGDGKTWVVEPDLGASELAMDNHLRRHGVTKQAAPGLDGCGEPCLCGGQASKHISGKACDLSGLQELGNKIRVCSDPGKYATPEAAVDQFLRGYHLHRPMKNEKWHVEALPTHVPKHQPDKHAPPKHHPAAHAHHCGHHGC